MDSIAIAVLLQLTSAVIAALVGITVNVAKVSNHHRKAAKEESRELTRLISQNTLMTCRIAIYDDHFSVNEKLEAYALYKKLHGNHQAKTYMDNLIGGDVDKYLEQHQIGD